MLQEEFTPLEIDEDSLAYGAHQEVGHGGHFLGAAHTLERFRTCFYRPLLSSTENFERWKSKGGARRDRAGGRDLAGDAGGIRAAAARPRRARPAEGVRRQAADRARRLTGQKGAIMAVRLAESMGRLGTETAFEVLARAKALEATGQARDPPRDRRARLRHAASTSSRPACARCATATPTTARRRGCRSCARRVRRTCPRTAAWPSTPAASWSPPGAKPFLFFGVLATCQPGDEVIYPNPGFPIYESVIRFAGATPVPLPLIEERGFAFTADDLAERLTPAHTARDPELAREPDRRDRLAGADRGDRRGAGRPRLLRPLRRGLLGDAVRRPPRHRRGPPRPARPHDPRRRVLEDVRDDGLAARLRGASGRAGRADHAPADQLRVLHRPGGATRRRRRADRSARGGGRDAGRVRAPPKRRRRRA